MSRSIAALTVAALLAGCSSFSDDGIPSLAKRDYELTPEQMAALAAEGDPFATPPEPDASFSALPTGTQRLANNASADVQQGQAAFSRQLPVTQRAVSAARGAPRDSDAWVEAQMHVTRLDSARAPSVAGMSALDALAAQTAKEIGGAYAAPIEAMAADAARTVSSQSTVIQNLAGQLR